MLLQLSEKEGMLFYKVVEKLADEKDLHESTIRWNLSKLRDAGLFIAGNQYNKGIPLELTVSGKMIASQYAETIKNGGNLGNEH
jgi:DNA-binding transcriptional ArsR family regulator